jgi:hypothetical protein
VCESLSYLTNPYQLQRLFIISSIAWCHPMNLE